MHIHIEESSEYRCHECRENCAVFILARESELRLCRSCCDKLRDALIHADMIPGSKQLKTPVARAAVQPSPRGSQISTHPMRTVKLRGVL